MWPVFKATLVKFSFENLKSVAYCAPLLCSIIVCPMDKNVEMVDSEREKSKNDKVPIGNTHSE